MPAALDPDRVWVAVDAATLLHLAIDAEAKNTSVDRICRAWAECWRTLGGLAHWSYQRLIAHAAAQRASLPTQVADLLLDVANGLPPPPRDARVRTPLDVVSASDVKDTSVLTRKQLAPRFTAQQMGQYLLAAKQAGQNKESLIRDYLGYWRTLGGLPRTPFQRIVYAANSRRLALPVFIASELNKRIGQLAPIAGEELVPTPLDEVPMDELEQVLRTWTSRKTRSRAEAPSD